MKENQNNLQSSPGVAQEIDFNGKDEKEN